MIEQIEGASQPVNSGFPLHAMSLCDRYAIEQSGYSYDANGKLTNRYGRTLSGDHKNRLSQYKDGSAVVESYLYDDTGQRIKKSAPNGRPGVDTYYVNQFYEVSGGTVTKYYALSGLPGNQRDAGPVVTDQRFTEQQYEGAHCSPIWSTNPPLP